MVDFAVELQRQGKSAAEAIHEACLVRFRPIMMTTMAALVGTLPIALGLGAGAESRRPLGSGSGRRLAGVAATDALHHARLLRLHRGRPCPSDASSPRARASRGRGRGTLDRTVRRCVGATVRCDGLRRSVDGPCGEWFAAFGPSHPRTLAPSDPRTRTRTVAPSHHSCYFTYQCPATLRPTPPRSYPADGSLNQR